MGLGAQAAELSAELQKQQTLARAAVEERDLAAGQLQEAWDRAREVEGKFEELKKIAEQQQQSHADEIEARLRLHHTRRLLLSRRRRRRRLRRLLLVVAYRPRRGHPLPCCPTPPPRFVTSISA